MGYQVWAITLCGGVEGVSERGLLLLLWAGEISKSGDGGDERTPSGDGVRGDVVVVVRKSKWLGHCRTERLRVSGLPHDTGRKRGKKQDLGARGRAQEARKEAESTTNPLPFSPRRLFCSALLLLWTTTTATDSKESEANGRRIERRSKLHYTSLHTQHTQPASAHHRPTARRRRLALLQPK